MARQQASKKTTPERTFIPGKHGGRLNLGGTPGNKGGGRRPDWLKDWCDDLLAKQESKAQVEAVLGNAKHPAYASMWKAVADRAHGRPKETVEHQGEIKHGVVILPAVQGK